MTLGVTLAIGESLSDLQNKGQLKRMLDYNIKEFSQTFDKVYVFSYEDESYKLPKNCQLIANKKKISRFLYSLIMPFQNKREFKECDVIRAYQITGGIPALVAKIFLRKPFIVNYGYDYPTVAKIEGKYIQSFLYPLLSLFIINFADRVIITSKQFQNKIKSQKTLFIPNGVDLLKFKPVKSANRSNKFVITYVGRLEREKNIDVIIKSISKIKNNRISFNVLGVGSEEKALKRLSKKLKVNANFFGKVDYSKLPRLLSYSDIFILISASEGNPKTLLEAQAMGIACLASDIKANREIIRDGKNGLLVDPTEEAVKKSIVSLIKNNKLRTNIAKEARNNAEKNYDIKKLLTEESIEIRKLALN